MTNFSGVTPQPQVDAETLVTQRFHAMQSFINEAYASLEDAIYDLSRYDPGYTQFSASTADASLEKFSGLYPFPDIPTPQTLVAAFPSAPARPDLGTVPSFTIDAAPDGTIPDFNDNFAFVQQRYIRDGLLAFRARLVVFINAGGTGLAANIEQAIYDRDKTRQEYIDEQRYLEIQNHFESRGNTMPSGQHAAALNSATKEATRMYEEISRSVMIKAAELEQENMRIAQESLLKTDAILVSLHGAEEQRDLDAEVARIGSVISVYEATIKGVIARLEAHKMTIEATVAYVNANVAVISANAEVYKADVSGYTAQVDAEAKRLSATANIYLANVSGIEAQIRGLSALADVDISQYKVKSDIAIANAGNRIKVHQLNLESSMKRIDVRVEAMKSIAAVSAQIVASGLNSVSTSASIGESGSVAFGYSYDETKDVIAVSHNFSGTL